MGARVLVIGSGGREHALAWRLARTPSVGEVVVAPGSAGMAAIARLEPVAASDLDGLTALAGRLQPDLVVIGPEQPLVAGLADRLRARGHAVFGPDAAGARLEGSKEFAKDLMRRAGVPTARAAVFTELAPALAHVRQHPGRHVVKADGLAAGKGVVMAPDTAAAERALESMLVGRIHGEAGARVLVEEWLDGEEATVFALTDGERFVLLPACQDHKRLLDGDRGPNTGGMGAISPAAIVDQGVAEAVGARIVAPVLAALRAAGTPYRGVLYVGLMITPRGDPCVIEFNVRFGDPEAQALLPRVRGDLYAWLNGAARGRLPEGALACDSRSAVHVVMAAQGYPETPVRGAVIEGLAGLGAPEDIGGECLLFHAGTVREGNTWRSAGGRVLGVTALAEDVATAREFAYAAVERLAWPGAQWRRDIGLRAAAGESVRR